MKQTKSELAQLKKKKSAFTKSNKEQRGDGVHQENRQRMKKKVVKTEIWLD